MPKREETKVEAILIDQLKMEKSQLKFGLFIRAFVVLIALFCIILAVLKYLEMPLPFLNPPVPFLSSWVRLLSYLPLIVSIPFGLLAGYDFLTIKRRLKENDRLLNLEDDE